MKVERVPGEDQGTEDRLNTFAVGSHQYASARPTYPDELFAWLAATCRWHDAAWDCATGSGQAAIGIAPYFGHVHATDSSAEQIAHATRRPNIEYSVQPAERTSFADGSFDAVTVAQALHWFDYDAFWQEVRRVARAGALFCAWGYAWFETDAVLADELVTPFREVVYPFWAPNNRILWDGYVDADIAFPFDRIEAPDLAIRVHWTPRQLLDYMSTWSSYKRAVADANAGPALAKLLARIQPHLDRSDVHLVEMPLRTVAGFIDGPP